MAPSLLLTTLAQSPDTTNPLNVDCTKRNSFGIITTHPGTYSGAIPNTASECHAYDASPGSRTLNRAIAGPWTGMPIRAVVPLPRRKRLPNPSTLTQDEATLKSNNVSNTSTSTSTIDTRLDCRIHLLDEDAECTSDSGDENGEWDEEEGEDDRGVSYGARFCSYESITAVGGLSAWSFEELRVECYAQSLVARGTKPPPVVQPFLAIPPAFVPRVVPRS